MADPDQDVDAHPSLLDKNGISRLFIDAVCYSEAISADDSKDGAPRNVHPDSIRRFADLVGRDLSQPDLAASERFAKITINTFLNDADVLGSPETDEISDGDGEGEGEGEAEEVEVEVENVGAPPASKAQPERSTSVSQLSEAEIVEFLINEFGPLTTSAADEERLVSEMEGAYFQEVVILGMIHITTHRITFHASLLSTRPDLLPEEQVIKTGPVTIHRTGLRRKRRVWLELSHDMLTTFPSGDESDRIKPVRSILLSTIKSVLPEDPKHKKILKLASSSEEENAEEKYAEFDTEEAAREWRREIQGAVYMYHHRRAVYLTEQAEDDSNGVRISIPLSRVKSHSCRTFLDCANVMSIELSPGKLHTGSRSSSESSGDEGSLSSPRSFDDEEVDIEGRTLELAVTQKLHAWDDFGNLVEKAKERERKGGISVSSKVIVDFGALSFVEQRRPTRRVEDDKEEAIRNALSFSQEDDVWYVRSNISRSIATSGFFVISTHYIGFWTKRLSIVDKKYRYPISKVNGARPNYRYRPHAFGMILDLKEHPAKYFDFASQELRDEVVSRVVTAVENYGLRTRASTMSPPPTPGLPHPLSPSRSRHATYVSGPLVDSPTPTSMADSSSNNTSVVLASAAHVLSPLAHTIDRATCRCVPSEALPLMPKVINLPADMLPCTDARHFVCLTIGSRGDVQPYIALAQELMRLGHSVTIVTHAEYKEWVEGWGVRHRTAGGDPGALMKLSVEHKMFSPQFFRASLGNFRTWLDDLLVDAWEQCKDADVLLESPSAMAGVHIAEALNIPYFRTFTFPWTKTTQYPHPFLSPPVELASFNTSTYILFDNMFWSATSRQINRWRRNTLHIGNTDMGHMAQSKIPFIYNFSPSVVPKPLDWGDFITISGYWFLDNPDLGWSPPESLTRWMAKAREDGKPIVYIGFGSITVPNPPAMTRSIVKAVLKSDVRAIISKGWSSRMSKSDEPKFEFPSECYAVEKIPHDWLFPQIDAALHHGGAGTTGASLRAGIPTLIKPWFGDQFFWASRVQKIGAGMKVSSLHSSELASAFVRATTDRVMKERAASVGKNIRSENGVQTAVKAIYTYLNRAGRDRTELD